MTILYHLGILSKLSFNLELHHLLISYDKLMHFGLSSAKCYVYLKCFAFNDTKWTYLLPIFTESYIWSKTFQVNQQRILLKKVKIFSETNEPSTRHQTM
jgi:hypothetical protein